MYAQKKIIQIIAFILNSASSARSPVGNLPQPSPLLMLTLATYLDIPPYQSVQHSNWPIPSFSSTATMDKRGPSYGLMKEDNFPYQNNLCNSIWPGIYFWYHWWLCLFNQPKGRTSPPNHKEHDVNSTPLPWTPQLTLLFMLSIYHMDHFSPHQQASWYRYHCCLVQKIRTSPTQFYSQTLSSWCETFTSSTPSKGKRHCTHTPTNILVHVSLPYILPLSLNVKMDSSWVFQFHQIHNIFWP